MAILDSGDRTEFETGAVRDIGRGKGRCDLMPLIECSRWTRWVRTRMSNDMVLLAIENFKQTGHEPFLEEAIIKFLNTYGPESKKPFDGDPLTLLLELSIHFEEGAEKYGENNWQKGIPVERYINSAVRHYLKWMRGDNDERHDRAFAWNIICAMWTCRNKPELNTYCQQAEDKLDVH